MKAIVTTSNKTAEVQSKDIPVIADDEILVKVISVALNPTDWKHVSLFSPANLIVGCDNAGIVEKVGKSVSGIQVGDKVGTLVHGTYYEHTGAFAEYAAASGHGVWKKADRYSFEETATFGVGCLTAAACLYQRLELPPPSKPYTASDPCYLLVWSGSSSVGQFAVQLGKLSGLTVVATASPKNHDLIRSLGATHVFDYRDPDVVKKIKEATNNKLGYAIDCVSEGDSQPLIEQSMGESGGKFAIILNPSDKLVRKDVKPIFELLYTAMGKEFKKFGRDFPAVPEDAKFVTDFIHNEMNGLMADGKLKPNVIKQMEGGIEKIPEGMDYMKAGKVSAEKLVYRIQNE